MKKIISMVLVMMLLCSGLAFAAAVPSDIKGSPYEEAILTLIQKEIITGDADGQFHPENKLTRAQACIMVVKAMKPSGADVNGTATQMIKSGFKDMAGYGWADGYIAYAVKKGVVNGYPDGTFKPGNMVKIEEITAMVLRASGYKDESLAGKYPSNFMDKGTEAGLFNGIVTTMIYPMQVSKGMTAKIINNGLSMIELANPQAPLDNNGQAPAFIPGTADKTYTAGTFNALMTEFDGKNISSDVKVYTYGKKADYKSTMILSKDASDYRLDTIYKYKNVNTPVWYAMTGKSISSMIIPMDAGFSGYAYGVINDTVTTLNAGGDRVDGVKTLVAGKAIMWLGTTALANIPAETNYLKGVVYEFDLRDGQIKSIKTAGQGRDVFKELTGTPAMDLIYSYEDGVARLVNAGGDLIAVKDNASVYLISDDGSEYKAGSLSSIRKDRYIAAYDMTDDDDNSADIVVVSLNAI